MNYLTKNGNNHLRDAQCATQEHRQLKKIRKMMHEQNETISKDKV